MTGKTSRPDGTNVRVSMGDPETELSEGSKQWLA